MPCIDVELQLLYPSPYIYDLQGVGYQFLTPGFPYTPGQYLSYSWLVQLTDCFGTVYAFHNHTLSGGSRVGSVDPSISITPLEALREETVPIIGFDECSQMSIRFMVNRKYRVCVPDSFCAGSGGLCLGGVARAGRVVYCPRYVSNLLQGGTLYYRLCTTPTDGKPSCEVLRPAGKICATPPPTSGDCFTTPCGQCCKSDRQTRVARLWHTDGNVYTVAAGTMTRNQAGVLSSYPAGCGTVGEALAEGDKSVGIADRADSSKTAGNLSVSLESLGDVIEGTSIDRGKISIFRTRDFGGEFTVQQLGITADYVASTHHRGRKIIVYFRKPATGAPAGTPSMFIVVGNLGDNGVYSFSTEKPLVVPATAPDIKCGDFELGTRPDGKVELSYMSSTPPCGLRILTSSLIELDGTNEWV